MRIISGSMKGRRLKCPPGKLVRPTSDMVKESLFNIIGSNIVDKKFLDLFSGTGNIGIEALSRGAYICYFVEKVYNNIKYIKENLSIFNSYDNAKVLHMDANNAIEYFNNNKIIFDYIYIDPPYYLDLYDSIMSKLGRYKILNNCGFVIVEHYKKIILNNEYGKLSKIRSSKYGETILTFFKEVSNEYSSISRQF